MNFSEANYGPVQVFGMKRIDDDDEEEEKSEEPMIESWKLVDIDESGINI